MYISLSSLFLLLSPLFSSHFSHRYYFLLSLIFSRCLSLSLGVLISVPVFPSTTNVQRIHLCIAYCCAVDTAEAAQQYPRTLLPFRKFVFVFLSGPVQALYVCMIVSTQQQVLQLVQLCIVCERITYKKKQCSCSELGEVWKL